MSVLLKTTIGEIAAQKPEAAKLFEVVGIDYACHGSLTLHDACADAGLDAAQIRRAVDELPRDVHELNWLERPLLDLIRCLRHERHTALNASLNHAISLLADHSDQCARHPLETAKLRNTLGGLANALRPHLSREEHVLFPILEQLDACWSRGELPTMNLTGGLGPAMNALMLEHAGMITTLDTARAVVDEIMDAPNPCSAIGVALRAFDHELRQHVHLQNNVLYPRALALETIASNQAIESGSHA